MRPEIVNILGIPHTVEYMDKPSDVDIEGRKSLLGQVDHWTHTIRIFDGGRPCESVFEDLVHEILHTIANRLRIGDLENGDNEGNITRLASAWADTLVRNGWVKLEEKR